mmetsp:Transcript_9552/g.14754  ORF Transcript_9552/g.14754 Transcript_9552/m.14754 type:complete len:370 (-) Transcript_9552:337-1446(-)
MAETEPSEQPRKRFLDGVTNFAAERKNKLKYIVIITLYVLLGTVIYLLWFDFDNFINALYFTTLTLTTIGYGGNAGDKFPKTNAKKLYTAAYVVIGVVVILGIYVNLLVNDLFDSVDRVRQVHEDARENHVLDKVEEKKKIKGLPVLETWLRAYGSVLKKNIPLLIACFVPSIIITIVEGWQWVEVIYYTVATATTLGYGDVSPQNEWMRLIGIFYCPFVVVTLGMVFSDFSNVYISRKTHEAEENFFKRKLTTEDLLRMDVNADGSITRAEFNSFMLVVMGKVDPEMIETLRSVFNRLDKNGDGKLSVKDLVKKIHYDMVKDELGRSVINLTSGELAAMEADQPDEQESDEGRTGDYSKFNVFPPNWC